MPPFTQSTQPSSPSAPFAPEKDDPEKDDADAQGTLPCLHPPCLDQLTHVTAFDQLTDLAAFSHTPQGPALQTLVLESSNPSPRVRPEDYNILVACHLMPNVSRCCRNAGIDCQSVGRGVGVVGGGVVCGVWWCGVDQGVVWMIATKVQFDRHRVICLISTRATNGVQHMLQCTKAVASSLCDAYSPSNIPMCICKIPYGCEGKISYEGEGKRMCAYRAPD